MTISVEAEFDRSRPLLERTRVPCEFITCGETSKQTNTPRVAPYLLRKKSNVFFSLRIFEGHRSIQVAGGTKERAIRFEISDECTKYHHLSATSQGNNKNDNVVPFSPMASMNANISQHERHLNTFKCDATSTFPSASTRNVVDTGPITLYELEVGESDFSDLRQDQALLVDFSGFAKSFVDLLQFCDLGVDEGNDQDALIRRNLETGSECNASAEFDAPQANPLFGCQLIANGGIIGHSLNPQTQQHGEGGVAPASMPFNFSAHGAKQSIHNYVCRLEDFSHAQDDSTSPPWNGNSNSRKLPHARFCIVESNQFRELIHLALNLQKGNDASVRAYASQRLAQSMGQNDFLKLRLQQEMERAANAEKTCKNVSNQCQQLSASSEAEKFLIKQQAGDTMQREFERQREDFNRKLCDKDRELEVLKDVMEKYRIDMDKRADSLLMEKANILQTMASVEAENIESRETVSAHESSIKLLTEQVSLSKSQLSELNAEKNLLEKSLFQTQLHVAALEKSNEKQETDLKRIEMLKIESEQIATQSQEKAESNTVHLCELKRQFASLEAESSSNKILLVKYQTDRQEMKRRMKAKVDMVRQQEELLASKETEFLEVQRQIENVSKELEKVRTELAKKDEVLAKANKEVENSKNVLENNQQVITWLNKEINDSQTGTGKRPSFQTKISGSAARFEPPSRGAKRSYSFSNTPYETPTFQSPHVAPDVNYGLGVINDNAVSAPSYFGSTSKMYAQTFQTPAKYREFHQMANRFQVNDPQLK